jgi:hypothetical protein
MQLEQESWSVPMQHSEDLIKKRLATIPGRIFVLEMGQQVVGAIQTQRMNGAAFIDELESWHLEDSLYMADGSVLQLFRVNTFLM